MSIDAKEYLEQVENIDIRIDNKLKERDFLYQMSISTSVPLSGERVQTSCNHDRIGAITDRRIDLENEIDGEIDDFVSLKHEIVNQINSLTNPKHIKLLHKKYIEYKTYNCLEVIADELGYSYDYIKELHGRALKEFEKILLNPTENPPNSTQNL